MAAYASLLSLGHILDHLLQHPPRQMAVLDEAQIDSLIQNISFLQQFLEEFPLTRGDAIQALEAKIVISAYAAEDIIESRVVDQILDGSEAGSEWRSSTLFRQDLQILRNSEAERRSRGIFSRFKLFLKKMNLPYLSRSSPLFSQDLQKVIENFGSMKKDVMEIQETEEINIVQQPTKDATAGSFVRGASSSKNTMVGSDEVLIQIMETLTGHQSNLRIISIVGMGGIGKTTLARNVYHHPYIVQHFHVHAWVTISQQYSVHGIVLALSKEIGVLAECSEEEGGEEITPPIDELGERLYKSLSDRKYLIVMDDLWSIECWNDIKRFFPDNNNGSRFMITTRQTKVADDFPSCTPHQLKFLGNDKSWALFCDKLFGKESCPPELEEVGKTIVRNCGGLPLAIVAISGLLAKSSRTVEYWEYVANNTYAALNIGGDGLCFEVLSLSYKHLPVHLKPCFLYMAIFPEDHNIRVSRLIKLWVAEGILKPIRSRSLEEIGEDNLKDLIDRNLIQVHDYGSRNKIKTCTIHDLLRDLCLREAQREKFLCGAMMHSLNNQSRVMDNKRRLIIHRSSDKESCQQQVIDAMNLASCTRSLTCCELESTSIKLPVCLRLLSVLSMDGIYSCKESLQLVNLTYIDFEVPSYPKLLNPLESLSLQRNLQSITIAGSSSGWPMNLPAEIWEMPQLYLPDHLSTNSKNGRPDIIVLKNLQTLYTMRNFRCTDEVVHRIPNLTKLGITFRWKFRWDYHEVYNLAPLRNLKTLFLDSDRNVLQNFCFPRSLNKLTLLRCRVRWEDLTVVGSLPQLEVVTLKDRAVIGRKWNPVEGQFLELKSLRIDETDLEEWIADSSHFPSLENLELGLLENLKEIPYGIGEIQTLRSISLVFCSDSANSSAKMIRKEQRDLGNYDLRLRYGKKRSVCCQESATLKVGANDYDVDQGADQSNIEKILKLELSRPGIETRHRRCLTI